MLNRSNLAVLMGQIIQRLCRVQFRRVPFYAACYILVINGGEFKLGMACLPGDSESNKPKLIRGDDFPSGIITKKNTYIYFTRCLFNLSDQRSN